MHTHELRECRVCGTEKPISEFYFRKEQGRHRKECKDCVILRQRFKKTGWCERKYEQAYVQQGGGCAICKSTLNNSRFTRLSGDHCHRTGQLRGLLCSNCNTAIGLMKDSPERLLAAVEYLGRCTKGKEIVSSTE